MRRFTEFVTLQTLIVGGLAVGCTWLCLRFNLAADIPTSLLGIAVIFPIVFAINAAFRRRERSLGWLADMKGAVMSLFFAYRDWVPKADGAKAGPIIAEASETLKGALERVASYLADEKQSKRAELDDIYAAFSRVSQLNERARTLGLPSTEVSRANQYLSHIIRDFEKVCTIKEYRTPMTLRGYWQIFLNLFPIFFAPSFANLALKSSYVMGFGTAILYTMVLVGLDNIQEKLEHPFDQDSIDDINLDYTAAYERTMRALREVESSG